MDYEKICEDFIRACKTMRDEEKIRKWYGVLKDFSEDDLVGKCDLGVGESIRARSILYQVGLFFNAEGEEREDIREDIMRAVDDFYNY